MKKYKNLIITVSMFMLVIAFTSTCYGADNIFLGTMSEVNATNSSDGYVKVRSLEKSNKSLKVIIEKDTAKYTYDLDNTGEYDVYPLQMGNGKYKIKVLENLAESKYSVKQTVEIDIKLNNANSPFLVTNQYVDYNASSAVVKKATELCAGKSTEMEKVDAIYNFVISNITYDNDKVSTVKSGYLPKVDITLSTKKGICFDYASMMAAMLRSQSIPAKLVTGYSTNLGVFHAWNEIYLKETGWITLNKMYFDGNTWKLMDSTIASTAKQTGNDKLIEYTNTLIDSKNYTKQFEY